MGGGPWYNDLVKVQRCSLGGFEVKEGKMKLFDFIFSRFLFSSSRPGSRESGDSAPRTDRPNTSDDNVDLNLWF